MTTEVKNLKELIEFFDLKPGFEIFNTHHYKDSHVYFETKLYTNEEPYTFVFESIKYDVYDNEYGDQKELITAKGRWMHRSRCVGSITYDDFEISRLTSKIKIIHN